MSKNKIIVGGIACLAAVGAVIGAVWTFAQGASSNAGVKVHVTNEATSGDIYVADSAKIDKNGVSKDALLTLDQGASVSEATDVTKGITFTLGGIYADYYLTETYSVSGADGYDAGQKDAGEAGVAAEYNKTFTITLSGGLENYIEPTDATGWTGAVMTGTWTDRTPIATTLAFKYKTGKKPQNDTEYKAMIKELAGGTLPEDLSAGFDATNLIDVDFAVVKK